MNKEYAAAVLQTILLVVMLAYLFYDSWIAGIVLTPVGILYFHQWREDCCRKKELEFRLQFRDAMQLMSSSLKTGYSVENAIRAAARELPSLYKKDCRICEEFERMVHKMDMNQTAEQVLHDFSARVRQEDAEHFVMVFSVAKRSGGDSIAILKSSIRIIGGRIETEREIQTMLAAKRLEFQVMCLIPLGMVLYMRMAFPEFLSILYGNPAGIMMMSVCLGIYVFAYRLGKKMIQIEI